MNQQQILDNVDNLTAEQLYDFINQGIVTIEELKKTGNLDASKRLAISKLQSKRDGEDDAAWEKCRYGNEIGLSDYISAYPAGRHAEEAKQRIDDLREKREAIRAQKRSILDKICRNPNSYSPSEILEFWSNDTITRDELEDKCGIPRTAIDNLNEIVTPRLQIGKTPDEIPSGYTEVYFWGGTGSGKTCALGAILRVAETKGYLNIATGPGYRYATQLKNIFSDDDVANDYLPAPSPLETTQYLPFTLRRPDEKHSRSVSLIELSGEIFKCFFYKNAGQQLPTQSHENTFNSLNNFLKSDNRKIHFFFIDYDKDNTPDRDGLKQSDYLTAASTYFENNAVFGRTTDAIYVVLTKSDLLTDDDGCEVPPEKRVEYAKKHLSAQYFTSFINTLKGNCKKYSINAGKLTVEPFSLGNVYFQQICNFEDSAAERILEILMDRIEVSKKSILDVFNQ
jgi:hypothetical protein